MVFRASMLSRRLKDLLFQLNPCEPTTTTRASQMIKSLLPTNMCLKGHLVSLPPHPRSSPALKNLKILCRNRHLCLSTMSPCITCMRMPSLAECLVLIRLLFGPPGTGKSSLIAAMANYLRFDIYDLDLKEVRMNSGLKRLLVGMTNKSLLVIEDIDCSVDLKNRDEDKENQSNNKFHDDEISLSGLLNFIDGLWSTSGEERIIVFTTNYKEKLDPALLRPGRMDMHVHMGYCGPNSFRILVSNYHAIYEHPMFEEIEGLLKEVKATPAEVAEQLMRSDTVDVALEGLIQLTYQILDAQLLNRFLPLFLTMLYADPLPQAQAP